MNTISIVDICIELVELLKTTGITVGGKPLDVKRKNVIYADAESVRDPTVYVAPIDKRFSVESRNGFERSNRVGIYLFQHVSEKNEAEAMAKQDALIRAGEALEEWISGGLSVTVEGREIEGQRIQPDANEQTSIFDPEALQRDNFYYQIILSFTQIVELPRE